MTREHLLVSWTDVRAENQNIKQSAAVRLMSFNCIACKAEEKVIELEYFRIRSSLY